MSLEAVEKNTITNPSTSKAPFRGWYILAVTVITQAITIGCTNYIYSLYTLPISQEFGASRMSMGSGMAIFLLAMGVYSPILGRIMDKGNKRNIMMYGGLLMAIGFALLSAATALWQMAIVLVLFIASGSGMMGSLASSTVVANWFERYRGRALGISLMGTSLGGAVIPLAAAPLIKMLGWRSSLLVIAAAIAIFAVLVVRLVIINAPKDIGQYPDGVKPSEEKAKAAAAIEQAAAVFSLPKLLRDPNFWRIAGCTALVMFAGVLLSTHFVPYAAELGIDSTAAALVLALFAMTGMVGKVFFGYLTDIVHAGRVFCVVALVDASAWALLLSNPDYSIFLVGVGIMGFGVGGAAPVMNAVIAKCFGPQVFGRVMGFVGVILLLLIAIPGPLGGFIYDKTGSYHLVFSYTFWVFPLAALVAWFIRIPEATANAGKPLAAHH
jgi:MFS family permease